MNITLLTPTCNRPFGIALAEKYVAAQTVRHSQWIVSDGGAVPAVLTLGQLHLHNPRESGARNLAGNILDALPYVTGDAVVITEDDDAYLPRHLESCIQHLKDAKASGGGTLNYYNIQYRKWIKMRNRGSALCQTAFRSELIPLMQQAAQECWDRNSYGIDARFWQLAKGNVHSDQTVIGIKGLPGTAGLGMGHRPKNDAKRHWTNDPGFKKLREWIGDAADHYVNAYQP